jgi:hypothetical protein
MERVTQKTLDQRIENLNRRMEQRGSRYRYSTEGRYGYTGLDRDSIDGKRVDTVRIGTKREVAELLHAMMVVLDDAEHRV